MTLLTLTIRSVQSAYVHRWTSAGSCWFVLSSGSIAADRATGPPRLPSLRGRPPVPPVPSGVRKAGQTGVVPPRQSAGGATLRMWQPKLAA